MNSIEFLNQLLQSVNSLNGIVFTLRSDIDILKKDLSNVNDSMSGIEQQTSVDEYSKKNEEQVQVILSNMDKTQLMVEEMRQKLSSVEQLYKQVSVDGDLDYFKTVSKETSEKLKNLEIAFTLKLNTLERSIKNIPKSITKDDIQSMIDQSITQLLEGFRPSPTLETLKDKQEQILSIPLEQDNNVNELTETVSEVTKEVVQELETETPVDVVIQSIEPVSVSVSETKPKRKKATKKTN
jgi:NhaP-type Na+/H+ and K+/H+ antiporter